MLLKTTEGEIGLVHKHCPHRRASLVFGRCDASGIRCCYHCWLFAPDGEALETPGEADDPGPAADVRARTRLGAYPIVEFRGLVSAYLGPADRKPNFTQAGPAFTADGKRQQCFERSLFGANEKFLVAAIAQNLRKLAKLLSLNDEPKLA